MKEEENSTKKNLLTFNPTQTQTKKADSKYLFLAQLLLLVPLRRKYPKIFIAIPVLCVIIILIFDGTSLLKTMFTGWFAFGVMAFSIFVIYKIVDIFIKAGEELDELDRNSKDK